MFETPKAFVVYVDLNGADRGAMITANNEDDAVKCVRKAWEENLLWHYKIYGDSDSDIGSEVKYADLPWDPESISKVLSAIKLKKDLDQKYENQAHRQNEIIEKYSKSEGCVFVPTHGEVELSAAISILEKTYKSLKNELLEKDVKVPKEDEESILEIFSYYQRIVKKLSQMEYFHANSENNYYAMRTPSISATEFVENLPKIEDIFQNYESKRYWLDLSIR